MTNQRKTPIMGWASWNAFRTDISEEILKQQADALVDTGLAACGYTYLNMDDGFFGGRDADGNVLFHKERFPNGIRPVADYAHSLGLQAGTYAEGGDNTCGFYYDAEGASGSGVGLYGHEEQDLTRYLEEFGFDFIKVDWCGGIRMGLDEEEQYTKIGNIIDRIRQKNGKPIVYNICRWQFPGVWATEIADSWRTGADIAPNFQSVLHQLDVVKPLARYCKPGHVNDLDMMQLGNGMSNEEEKTHFAMWCMMSTPLMIGCDLTKISPQTLEILKNEELIAIHQDSACLQAFPIREMRDAAGNLQGEIWIKNLGAPHSAEKAIAFLNRSDAPLEMDLAWKDAGLCGEIFSVRNICTHKDIAPSAEIRVSLKPYETIVCRVRSERAEAVENPDDKPFVWKPLQKISLERALELQKNGAYLVDVRSPEEFAVKHLDGAVNLPYMDIHGIAVPNLHDKTNPVIVYCATGKRSLQAKNSLEYLGYETVYFLGGVTLS